MDEWMEGLRSLALKPQSKFLTKSFYCGTMSTCVEPNPFKSGWILCDQKEGAMIDGVTSWFLLQLFCQCLKFSSSDLTLKQHWTSWRDANQQFTAERQLFPHTWSHRADVPSTSISATITTTVLTQVDWKLKCNSSKMQPHRNLKLTWETRVKSLLNTTVSFSIWLILYVVPKQGYQHSLIFCTRSGSN